MTISSSRIWDKVLCVIFPQIITHASVPTKYELIGNVYIIMAINYIEQKCKSQLNLISNNDINFNLESLVSSSDVVIHLVALR